MIYRDVFVIDTKTDQFYEISEEINKIVMASRIVDGLANVFVKGTTAALLINENDRMLIEDFRRLLETLAPREQMYQHPENAQSHLRAALLTNSITMPVAGSQILLGSWQNVLLFEFDVTRRKREVVVTVYGE